MAPSASAGELRTALPLLVPVWVLSILSGVVFEFNAFLAGSLALLVVYAAYRSIVRISSAERFSVNVVEIAILNLLVPILGALSFISSIYLPIATVTVNLVLLSTAIPLLALILRIKSYRRYILYVASTIIMLNPLMILICLPLTFSTLFALTTISVHSLIILGRAVFLHREQVPLSVLKYTSIVLIFILAGVSFYSYSNAYQLFPASIIALLIYAAMFCYFDALDYQMRYPEWNKATLMATRDHVLLKICAVWVVAMWAVLVPLHQYIERDEEMRKARGDTGQNGLIFPAVTFWTLVTLMAHISHMGIKSDIRERNPLPPSTSSRARSSDIAVIAALVGVNILIACCYVFSSTPACSIMFAIIASIFLFLTQYLDNLRVLLLPISRKLAWIFFGISVYLLAAAIYLSTTAPNHAKYKAIRNFTTRFNLNVTASDVATNYILLNITSLAEESILEWIRFRVIRACVVASYLSFLLVLHFAFAVLEENERRKKVGDAVTRTLPQEPVPSVLLASVTENLPHQEQDSDYESVDIDDGVREAAV